MHSIPARSSRRPGDRRRRPSVSGGGRLLAGGFMALVAGCGADSAPGVASEPASFLPANAPPRDGCGSGGLLQGTVYGALDGEIHWTGDAMDCEGMPRPEGRGMRLRFAGEAGEDATALAIIIGVADIGPRETAAELPSNVTIIEEGRGRFFSTSDLDSCWTDIERQTLVDAGASRYEIDGTLYCIAPLAEVNGSGSVSVPELRFSGLVDWESS